MDTLPQELNDQTPCGHDEKEQAVILSCLCIPCQGLKESFYVPDGVPDVVRQDVRAIATRRVPMSPSDGVTCAIKYF